MIYIFLNTRRDRVKAFSSEQSFKAFIDHETRNRVRGVENGWCWEGDMATVKTGNYPLGTLYREELK